MSEELDKVKSVKYLPIYLWDDVLMPVVKTVKAVHFHKPQDTALLKDIMRDNKMFGACYSEKGALPKVGDLGCVAEVISKVNFKSGDSNVKFEGVIRFKIENFVEMNTPYPLAEVSFYEDEPEDEDYLFGLAADVGDIFRKMMEKSLEPYGKAPEAPAMRPKPIPFSFVMGDLFSFDPDTKLEMLASRKASERLEIGADWMSQFVEAVEESNENHKFVKAFANFRNDPNLS